MNEWFPNFTDPKNEIIVFGNGLIAVLSILIPMLTAADFTTLTGVIAFVTAAAAVVMRQGVWSASSIAELSAEPVGEIGQ